MSFPGTEFEVEIVLPIPFSGSLLKDCFRRVCAGLCSPLVGLARGNQNGQGEGRQELASHHDALLFDIDWYGRQGQFAPDAPDRFRTWYGPIHKAFAALPADGARALERDLTDLLNRWNRAGAESLMVPSQYLEVVITRR